MEHELSGLYDVTHGAGLAVIFPAWMKCDETGYFTFYSFQFAYGVAKWISEPENTAREGIERYEQFMKSIGMPTPAVRLGCQS